MKLQVHYIVFHGERNRASRAKCTNRTKICLYEVKPSYSHSFLFLWKWWTWCPYPIPTNDGGAEKNFHQIRSNHKSNKDQNPAKYKHKIYHLTFHTVLSAHSTQHKDWWYKQLYLVARSLSNWELPTMVCFKNCYCIHGIF